LPSGCAACWKSAGLRYDFVDALLAAPGADQIARVVQRGDALAPLIAEPLFLETAQVATRVRNILRSDSDVPGGAPDRDLLATPEEKTLLAALDFVEPTASAQLDAGDFGAAFGTLGALNEPTNRFFDNVLVMAEDPALRQARLALLARADRLYLRLLDFSKLVTE
jgi:glycyl-tRNA synthetase beta chain